MQLNTLRNELRDWEQQFKGVHERKPTVQDAPLLIRTKYELLAKLTRESKDILNAESQTSLEEIRKKNERFKGTLEISKPVVSADDEGFERVEFQLSNKKTSINNNSNQFLSASSIKPPRPAAGSTLTKEKCVQLLNPQYHDLTGSSSSESESSCDEDYENVREEKGNQSISRVNLGSDELNPDGNDLKRQCVEPRSSFAALKFEPNFVRMNLKKDWRARHAPISRSSKNCGTFKSDKFFKIEAPTIVRTQNPDEAIATIVDILEKGEIHADASSVSPPQCGHHMPSVEKVVKKASTGRKGHTFYACSFSREASCGFFQWKDDTSRVAREAFQTRVATKDLADGRDTCELPAWIAAGSIAELKIHLKRIKAPILPKSKADLLVSLRGMWEERVLQARALRGEELADLRKVLRTVFMHDEFLPGQLEAIQRILAGINSLIIRATGSGKSLIYQLPAFVSSGLTLVISPLISLMQDQLSQLPPGLMGRALTGTQRDQAVAIADILSGRAKILFISPERLFTSSFQTLVKRLPRVSLVCIDEAHCLSAWSHNFRPSFLRLGEAVGRLFQAATLIALSATATLQVQREISSNLGIQHDNGGIQTTGSWQRSNLHLRVEAAPVSDDTRFKRLVDILRDPLFTTTTSKASSSSKKAAPTIVLPSIVYTTTKNETRVIAERLVAQGISAAPYHAALEPAFRKKVQGDFMSGKVSVVVATVAFGMGLNKIDVRKVIHFRAPRTIEGYVQEIGRAGRDGDAADCVCLLDDTGEETRRLMALARADGMEKAQLRRLLDCLELNNPLNVVSSVIIQSLASNLDIKEEVLETILVFLQQERFLRLDFSGFARAEISFRTDRVNKAFPIVMRARASATTNESGKQIVDLCQLAQSSSGGSQALSVSSIIKQLCDARDADLISKLTLCDPCWFIQRIQTLDDKSKTLLVETLKVKTDLVERVAVNKIESIFAVLQKGIKNPIDMSATISEYLESDLVLTGNVPFAVFNDTVEKAYVGDVKSLHRDPQFTLAPKWVRTPRAMVRIMLGIPSPAFPLDHWSAHRFWAKYKKYAFEELYQSAARTIFQLEA